jgi:hypothetical protein
VAHLGGCQRLSPAVGIPIDVLVRVLGSISPQPPNALTTSLDGECAFANGVCPVSRGQPLTIVGSHGTLRAITPLFSDGQSVSDHRERQGQGFNNVHSMPERADTGISA